jgi:hypothetical protein
MEEHKLRSGGIWQEALKHKGVKQGDLVQIQLYLDEIPLKSHTSGQMFVYLPQTKYTWL